MIVYDFHLKGVPVSPIEANAPLVVDANGMKIHLLGFVVPEGFDHI
jgi:hypothetical protein